MISAKMWAIKTLNADGAEVIATVLPTNEMAMNANVAMFQEWNKIADADGCPEETRKAIDAAKAATRIVPVMVNELEHP